MQTSEGWAGDDDPVSAPALGVTAVEIDQRFTIYNPVGGRVLTLNETASDVWRLCDGSTPPSVIVAYLAAAYSQPADMISGSIVETLELFRREGLLAAASSRPDQA